MLRITKFSFSGERLPRDITEEYITLILSGTLRKIRVCSKLNHFSTLVAIWDCWMDYTKTLVTGISAIV
jgi:hypothetical protein